MLKAPLAFYQSSFILGAVNIPDIIEVEKLKPNTIIVDDSAPHCFNVEKAINRLNTKSDILFTEGGILRAPYKIKELRYIPKPQCYKSAPCALAFPLPCPPALNDRLAGH